VESLFKEMVITLIDIYYPGIHLEVQRKIKKISAEIASQYSNQKHSQWKSKALYHFLHFDLENSLAFYFLRPTTTQLASWQKKDVK
jgi:hypothetical protein